LTATARQGYKDAHDEAQSDQACTVEDIVEKLELVLSEETLVLSTSKRSELAFHFEYITPSYTCPKCKYTYEYQVEVGSCPECQFSPFVQRQERELAVTEGEAAFRTTINALGAKIFKQFQHTLLKPDRKPYYTQEPRILAEKEEEEELEAIAAFAKNTSLSQAPQHLYTTLHYAKASMERDDTVQKL